MSNYWSARTNWSKIIRDTRSKAKIKKGDHIHPMNECMDYDYEDILRAIRLLTQVRKEILDGCALFKNGDYNPELIEMMELCETCNEVFFRLSVLSRNVASKLTQIEHESNFNAFLKQAPPSLSLRQRYNNQIRAIIRIQKTLSAFSNLTPWPYPVLLKPSALNVLQIGKDSLALSPYSNPGATVSDVKSVVESTEP